MLDETPIDIGSLSQHIEYITTREGISIYNITKREGRKLKFTLQTLAACYSDFIIQRPYKVFILENKLKKEEIVGELRRARALVELRAKKIIIKAKSNLNSTIA